MNREAQSPVFSRNVPPSLDQVKAYSNFLHVLVAEAEIFFFYYQGMDWHSESGRPVRDWAMIADDWVWNLEN